MMEKIVEVPIDRTFVSPWNPRRYIDEVKLAELVEGIRSVGVILQPPVARVVTDPMEGGELYEIAVGQRRLEAAKRLGHKTIKLLIRTLTDEDLAALALQENTQRDDTPPLDEAAAFSRCMEAFGWNAEQLADRIGKGRGYVYSRLRIAKGIENERLRERINRGGVYVRDAETVAGWGQMMQMVFWERLEEMDGGSAAAADVTHHADPKRARTVLRQLTPRAEALRWWLDYAVERRLRADQVLDERGMIAPGKDWVDVREEVDETILVPRKLPAGAPKRITWRWVMEQVGEIGLAVYAVEPVAPKWSRLEAISRRLVLEAAATAGLKCFRTMDVSVDRARRLAEARAADRERDAALGMLGAVGGADLSDVPRVMRDFVRLGEVFLPSPRREAVERARERNLLSSVAHELAAVLLLMAPKLSSDPVARGWLEVYGGVDVNNEAERMTN